MANSSMRNLVSGSGTFVATQSSRVLTFSQSQSFKEGATIYGTGGAGALKFTIDVGAGTVWTALQTHTSATTGSQTFLTSDPSTSRARGSNGLIVPRAPHFVYVSSIDSSGNPDWYFYVDTLFPENGMHPYTFDIYAPPPWAAGPGDPLTATPILIPDLPTRVRILEGILRGQMTGNTPNPDARLDNIEAAIAGLAGTPPAGPFTLDQLLSFGDPAPA
jgi:hypothetical protein